MQDKVEELRERANHKADKINQRHRTLIAKLAKRIEGGKVVWCDELEFFLGKTRMLEAELRECHIQIAACRSIDGQPNDPSKYRKEHGKP